jgi:hypothetical protein
VSSSGFSNRGWINLRLSPLSWLAGPGAAQPFLILIPEKAFLFSVLPQTAGFPSAKKRKGLDQRSGDGNI